MLRRSRRCFTVGTAAAAATAASAFAALQRNTPQRREAEIASMARCLRDTMIVVMEETPQKLPASATSDVLCVFPPFHEMAHRNSAQPLEPHVVSQPAASAFIAKTHGIVPSHLSLVRTVRLPLTLALNFPLKGATPEDRLAFVHLGSRVAAHRQQQQQQQQKVVAPDQTAITPAALGINNSDDSSLLRSDVLQNLLRIFGASLPSRRVLLFIDAQESLPRVWNIPVVENSLRGIVAKPQYTVPGKTAASLSSTSASFDEIVVGPANASSVWCCTFAQWYLDRSEAGAQLQVPAVAARPGSQPLPPVVYAHIAQLAEARSQSSLACALVKMETMACTSQMTHIGLRVEDDAFFAEQQRRLHAQRDEIVADMTAELRRFMPDWSASGPEPWASFMGSKLKDVVLGHLRATDVVMRPLLLAHGWVAVSLYLHHWYRVQQAKQEQKQQSQAQEESAAAASVLLQLPHTTPHCLQYACNYFSVVDDKSSSASSASAAASTPTAATVGDAIEHELVRGNATASLLDRERNALQPASQSFDAHPEQGRVGIVRQARAPPFDFAAMMPSLQLTSGYPLSAKRAAQVAQQGAPAWLLRSAEPLRQVRGAFDAERALLREKKERQKQKGADDDDDIDEAAAIEAAANTSSSSSSSSSVSIAYSSATTTTTTTTTFLPRDAAALVFDIVVTMRLVVAQHYGEELCAEVTAPTGGEMATRIFKLHDGVALREFLCAHADCYFKGKLRALVVLLDGATSQDLLLLSLLRRMSAEEMQAADVSVSVCIVDHNAVVNNLNRMLLATASTSTTSSSSNDSNGKAADAELLDGADIDAALTAHLTDKFGRPLAYSAARQSQRTSDEPSGDDDEHDASAAVDPSSPNRTTTAAMMAQLVALHRNANERFFRALYDSNRGAWDPNRAVTGHDLAYLVLFVAGNALTSAPQYDPFASCTNLAVQSGVARDGILVDRLPDSPFRSRLLTALHSDQPLVETLSRHNSPLAKGVNELEDLQQVISDLDGLRRSANKSVSTGRSAAAAAAVASTATTAPASGQRFLCATIRHSSTPTGRLSAANPNIFAIPKSPHIRGAFRSRFSSRGRGGGVMIEADYSQMEVIVLCALTGDAAMHSDLMNRVNFHNKRITFLKPELSYREVCELLKKGDPEVTALRRIAKMFTFQRQYGAGARSIAAATGLELATVQQLMDAESKAYPGVERYFTDLALDMLRQRTMLAEQGGSNDSRATVDFGRNSSLSAHDRFSSSARQQHQSGQRSLNAAAGGGAGKKRAQLLTMQLPTGTMISFEAHDVASSIATPKLRNYPVQALAADIMQLALAELWARLRARGGGANNAADGGGGSGSRGKAVIVNMVHDSVWLDVSEDCVDETRRVVRSVMEGVGVHALRQLGLDMLANKFEVEISVGPVLSEMKVVPP